MTPTVGIDIERISRFEGLSVVKHRGFVERVYSKKEIEECRSSKDPCFERAEKFTAKEAVYKALSPMRLGVPMLNRIEALKGPKNALKICVLGREFSQIKIAAFTHVTKGHVLVMAVAKRTRP